MDDKRRKMRKERICNIRELLQTEKYFNTKILAMVETYYQKPMQAKFGDKYEHLFVGLEIVKYTSDIIIESLEHPKNKDESYYLGNMSEDLCMKARMGDFIEKVLLTHIKGYKAFFMHVSKSLSFLNNLPKKDPLAKWMEDVKLNALTNDNVNVFELDNYFDSIMKRPTRIDLLLKTTLKHTHETEPDFQKLQKEYELLQDYLVNDLQGIMQDEQQEKIMNEVLVKMKPSVDIQAVACQFRKRNEFCCLERVNGKMEEREMLFLLFDGLLLYGVFEGGVYKLHGRFYMHDSEVELEDGVITLQDYEKCIYFFSVDKNTSKLETSVAESWYKEINDRIIHQRKRQITCGICGHLCCLEYDEEMIKRFSSGTSRSASAPAVQCTGCGRAVCWLCMRDMQSEQRADAVDKTRFCLHCQNSEKRGWERPSSDFGMDPSQNLGEDWYPAVTSDGKSTYLFNRTSKAVLWGDGANGDFHEVIAKSTSSSGEELSASSYLSQKDSQWLMYHTPEGMGYYWSKGANHTAWTMKSNDSCKERFCPNCGYSSSEGDLSCPKCRCRWSL